MFCRRFKIGPKQVETGKGKNIEGKTQKRGRMYERETTKGEERGAYIERAPTY